MSGARRPPIDYISRTRRQYAGLGHEPYRWADNRDDPPPWTLPDKPLSTCRVSMIATGGVHQVGQVAFTHKDDTTHRAVPTTAPVESLRVNHFAYDLAGARRDINVVFPIEPLRRLAATGVIGELGPRAYTCMGGIYSQRRVREELAPDLVRRCLEDELDVVLLVPV